MDIFLALFTYFAYVFIIAAYTAKFILYLRLPVHLRWELFTATDGGNSGHGHLNPEGLKRLVSWSNTKWSRNLWSFVKEYLWFPSYLSHGRVYWLVLYIAHVGFIGLILFQFTCITMAVGNVLWDNQPLLAPEPEVGILIAVRITLGVLSFATGIFGNIGLFLYRINNRNLRLYTPPLTFIGYCLTIAISTSGFILWLTSDPRFSQYVYFFVGLIKLQPIEVSNLLGLFILLNAFHLVYLPFTPGFHYITRAFAFFGLRWDVRPNVRGGNLEKKISRIMKEKLTWSAPHIKPGQTWEEAAKDRR